MQLLNAVEIARMTMRAPSSLGAEIAFGTVTWFVYAGISCFLVLFAGIMSGLTLGLMSLGLVELEILQRSGTPLEKKQAATIFPVVQKQHQLLVTLLLCNAASMEALPIYLDKIFNQYVAIILSVTFVLAFGEVISTACLVWLVRVLMVLCYPIAYPIGKVTTTVFEQLLQRYRWTSKNFSLRSSESSKEKQESHQKLRNMLIRRPPASSGRSLIGLYKPIHVLTRSISLNPKIYVMSGNPSSEKHLNKRSSTTE
ncbi:hypothetical protein R3W88_001597 [Solanum pinnatisectum]|uniref:CNNM transmembrane domain-containing protein n=1 Tax=Solanum pinnatisectum TaxID=50273 RepID=A0AAV9MM07_9SOLN|nr:hypothetical protein R3W88_001597 [Solanum pinnatisectum]